MSLEENAIKKTRKSNPGRPLKRIDYRRVAYWASRMVSQKIIAHKVGFTPEGLCRRKKRDRKLREALDRSIDGQIALHVQQYEKAVGHHYTACCDCGKRADYFELFSICPFCKSPHVRHSIIPGNTRLLIYLGRIKLGQTNASLKRQNQRSKIEKAKEITPEEAEKNLEELISYLNAEYGEKGDAKVLVS